MSVWVVLPLPLPLLLLLHLALPMKIIREGSAGRLPLATLLLGAVGSAASAADAAANTAVLDTAEQTSFPALPACLPTNPHGAPTWSVQGVKQLSVSIFIIRPTKPPNPHPAHPPLLGALGVLKPSHSCQHIHSPN